MPGADREGSVDHAPSARWHSCFRVKTTGSDFAGDVPRYHTVFDLVNVSLAPVLAISVFVLAGQAAKDLAGPSANLSVLLAALAALLSGNC